jgi:hypothetical protein
MSMGIKLNALGFFISLQLSHFFFAEICYIVGAILSGIGIIMIFSDK